MTKEGFFFGVMSVTFLGPGNGLSKMRGVFQKGGGILCFGMFSNVMLRDMLAVKYKDKKQINVRVLFGKSCCH